MAAIGFIGLGAMGSRMATRLLLAGHTLTVYNRTAEAAQALQQQGAHLAITPRAVAEKSDIVFSMVRDDEASHHVWLHPQNGAVHGLKPSSIAIECSTITPHHAITLAQQCQNAGIAFLDAPVAGSRPQAEAGQLIFLVGGDTATLEAAAPLMRIMGGSIHHVGAQGKGAAIKLAINGLFAMQVAALAETLGWLEKAGISTSAAVDVFSTLPTTSPALQGIGKLMGAGNDAPLFPIDLVVKDLRYAAQMADLDGALPTLIDTTRQQFEYAAQHGLAAKNIHAIRRMHESK